MQEKFARLFMSIAAILGAITVLTLSAESRPHWRGLLLAGLAKLHRAFSGKEEVPYKPRKRSPLHRVFEGLQRDAVDQVLQAVKFTDKNAPGLSLALDEEFQAANYFTELIRGYTMCVVESYIMMGLQPTGPTRVNLEVIVPFPKDLLQQCGSRQPLCAHLSGRPTIASLACGTRPKVSTSTLHNLSSKYSIVICLLIGKSTARSWRVECYSNDQPTMCQKRLFGNM